MQVLLIDDDVELGVLLEKFLKKEGYHLDREYEGTRGLRRALEGGHDLVVLDVMLPGLDGFERRSSIALVPRAAAEWQAVRQHEGE